MAYANSANPPWALSINALPSWQTLLADTRLYWWSQETYAQRVKKWTPETTLKKQQKAIAEQVAAYEHSSWLNQLRERLFGDIIWKKQWLWYQHVNQSLSLPEHPLRTAFQLKSTLQSPVDLVLPKAWKRVSQLLAHEMDQLLFFPKRTRYDAFPMKPNRATKINNRSDTLLQKIVNWFKREDTTMKRLVSLIYPSPSWSTDESVRRYAYVCGCLGMPLVTSIEELHARMENDWQSLDKNRVKKKQSRGGQAITPEEIYLIVKEWYNNLNQLPRSKDGPPIEWLQSASCQREFYRGLGARAAIQQRLYDRQTPTLRDEKLHTARSQLEKKINANQCYLQQAYTCGLLGKKITDEKNHSIATSIEELKQQYAQWRQGLELPMEEKNTLLRESDEWCKQLRKPSLPRDAFLEEAMRLAYQNGKQAHQQLAEELRESQQTVSAAFAKICGIVGIPYYRSATLAELNQAYQKLSLELAQTAHSSPGVLDGSQVTHKSNKQLHLEWRQEEVMKKVGLQLKKLQGLGKMPLTLKTPEIELAYRAGMTMRDELLSSSRQLIVRDLPIRGSIQPALRENRLEYGQCCALLGLDPHQTLSKQMVLTQYREAAIKHHPDKGIPVSVEWMRATPKEQYAYFLPQYLPDNYRGLRDKLLVGYKKNRDDYFGKLTAAKNQLLILLEQGLGKPASSFEEADAMDEGYSQGRAIKQKANLIERTVSFLNAAEEAEQQGLSPHALRVVGLKALYQVGRAEYQEMKARQDSLHYLNIERVLLTPEVKRKDEILQLLKLKIETEEFLEKTAEIIQQKQAALARAAAADLKAQEEIRQKQEALAQAAAEAKQKEAALAQAAAEAKQKEAALAQAAAEAKKREELEERCRQLEAQIKAVQASRQTYGMLPAAAIASPPSPANYQPTFFSNEAGISLLPEVAPLRLDQDKNVVRVIS